MQHRRSPGGLAVVLVTLSTMHVPALATTAAMPEARLLPQTVGVVKSRERVIVAFQSGNDGAEPVVGLIADAKGSLYGTKPVRTVRHQPVG